MYFDDVTIKQTVNPVTVTDYYPFGMVMDQVSADYKNPLNNKFLYNGIELEPKTGLYETLFRLYDPAIGRFTQIDPLADFFPGINPYSFGYDNPILYGDPDGLGPIKDFFKKLFNGYVGDGASKQAKRSQRKNNAVGVARNKGKGKKSNGNQSEGNGDPRLKYVVSNATSIRPDLSPSKPNMPDIRPVPVKEIPEIGKRPKPDIIPRTGQSLKEFNERVFVTNDDEFLDREKTIKDLFGTVEMLKRNTFIKIIIQVNTPVSYIDSNGDFEEWRDDCAMNIVRNRAREMKKVLEEMGIDPSRIEWEDHDNQEHQSIKIIRH